MSYNCSPYLEGKEGTLMCPKCEGNNLHHGAVKIYERREDQPTTEITIKNETKTIEIENDSQNNPSKRRNAVGIYFECEECGPVGELTISQHKGSTFVEWREI